MKEEENRIIMLILHSPCKKFILKTNIILKKWKERCLMHSENSEVFYVWMKGL